MLITLKPYTGWNKSLCYRIQGKTYQTPHSHNPFPLSLLKPCLGFILCTQTHTHTHTITCLHEWHRDRRTIRCYSHWYTSRLSSNPLLHMSKMKACRMMCPSTPCGCRDVCWNWQTQCLWSFPIVKSILLSNCTQRLKGGHNNTVNRPII